MTGPAVQSVTRAVFFDVDFTLIYPGPAFQGGGYRDFCARHGVVVNPDAFDRAVASASSGLDPRGDVYDYDAQIYIDYTRRIIEGMGGAGPGVEAAARDIYAEWAACHHFAMYDDVPAVLRTLHASGLKIGLISNSHRCLDSFQTHFALEGLFSVAVSSHEHGYLKPHPSIFNAALQLIGVEAKDAVMVGDSLGQDVAGALSVGMRAVLVRRGPGNQPFHGNADAFDGVAVIHSLQELLPIL